MGEWRGPIAEVCRFMFGVMGRIDVEVEVGQNQFGVVGVEAIFGEERGIMTWILLVHFGASFVALLVAIYLMRKADGQAD